MLDDYTPDNGALRLVPGSHRRGRLPRQALADPLADHPDQVLVTGRAGTAVVLDAHARHAGTAKEDVPPLQDVAAVGRPNRTTMGLVGASEPARTTDCLISSGVFRRTDRK
jgi:hypothetical protein